MFISLVWNDNKREWFHYYHYYEIFHSGYGNTQKENLILSTEFAM